jgi:hypothetical protein
MTTDNIKSLLPCPFCGGSPELKHMGRHYGVCDEPRINRANGDSECHSITPRVVIAEYLIAASDSAQGGAA